MGLRIRLRGLGCRGYGCEIRVQVLGMSNKVETKRLDFETGDLPRIEDWLCWVVVKENETKLTCYGYVVNNRVALL